MVIASVPLSVDSSKDQIIEGYRAVDELQYRSDGYISKTYDSDAWTKRLGQLEQGKTIIMVNRLVWMGLPEHERILWGRLGDIEQVKGTSPRLIEKVMPEAQKAIQGAMDENATRNSLRKWIRSCSTRRRLDYCSGFETDIRGKIEIWLVDW